MQKRFGKTKSTSFLILAAVMLSLLTPKSASAQRELMTQTGGKGQLSIDTLVGMNIGIFNGPTYSGPVGIMRQSYSASSLAAGVETQRKHHYTTIWLSPAADYFVINGLSVGALFELAHTSGSYELPINGNARDTVSLPSTLNFTFLPRVGYMFALGDRFGIWPRLSVGYASREHIVQTNLNNPQTERFGAFMLGLDVPVIFRINETFYLSAAPQFLTSLGGSYTTEQAGAETSADGSFLQFGLKTGVGVFLDLL